MPTYSRLVIEQVFDEIWENWLNKDGERAAQKAVEVCLKSDHKKEDLIKACEIYRLEHINDDPSFTYKLSNFILNDHWQDTLAEGSLDTLVRQKQQAEELMERWNKACRPHWCKCHPKARLPMALQALKNQDFRDKWKEALKKAEAIFRYVLPDSDPRRKITLSFAWFTSTKYDKHTVLRIMEGEYGKPIKEVVLPKEKPVVPVDQEERSKLAVEVLDFAEEIFPGFKQRKQLKQRIQDGKRKTKTPEQIKREREAAQKILKGMGVHTEDGFNDDEFTLS